VAILGRVKAVLVGVVVLTAACGGSSTNARTTTTTTTTVATAAPAAGFKVCDAITQAEGTEATGVALGAPTANGAPNCQLSTAGFTLSLHLVTGTQAKTDFTIYDAAAKKDVRTYAAVTAGDAAFSNLNNGRVLKGNQEIVVEVSVDGGVIHPKGANMQDAVAAQAYYATTMAAPLEVIAPHLTG
jgi:hypothetical protein